MPKYITAICSIICFQLSAIVVSAAVQKAEKENGLQLISVFGYIPVVPDRSESVLTGTVFIKNVSNQTVEVVVGPILGPFISPHSIRYAALFDTSEFAENIKPSPGSLDITELKPGEVVGLKRFNLDIKKAEDGDTRINYSVDEKFHQYYPQIWVGKLELVIKR